MDAIGRRGGLGSRIVRLLAPKRKPKPARTRRAKQPPIPRKGPNPNGWPARLKALPVIDGMLVQRTHPSALHGAANRLGIKIAIRTTEAGLLVWRIK